MRIDKRTMHMINAKLYSRRSTCCNKQEGSLIVIDNLTFGGYVGNQPKQTHCMDVYEKTNETTHCNCNSSEYNALCQILLSKYPVSTHDGATIYITGQLNLEKTNQIVTAGINEIVYTNIDKFEEDEIKQFAKFNDVKLICFTNDEDMADEYVADMMKEVNELINTPTFSSDEKSDNLFFNKDEEEARISLLLSNMEDMNF